MTKMSEGETVTIRYPSSDGTVTAPSLLDWGRFSIVFGQVPEDLTEGRYLHAYMVVNRVYDTVEYYSHSFVQARATMHQLDGLWDNLDEAAAVSERMEFAEEDEEIEAEAAAAERIFSKLN